MAKEKKIDDLGWVQAVFNTCQTFGWLAVIILRQVIINNTLVGFLTLFIYVNNL